MFPVTITINTADQLNAVMLALGGPIVGTVETTTSKAPAEKKPVAEKSQPPVKNSETTAAVTATVDTPATAAPAAAPEQKAAPSVAILDKDALTAATKAAIAKVGRDDVVALIQSYGAAKGSEIATEKRAEFDAKLLALAA